MRNIPQSLLEWLAFILLALFVAAILFVMIWAIITWTAQPVRADDGQAIGGNIEPSICVIDGHVYANCPYELIKLDDGSIIAIPEV